MGPVEVDEAANPVSDVQPDGQVGQVLMQCADG